MVIVSVVKDMLCGVDMNTTVFAQGPGFNIGSEALNDLNKQVKQLNAISSSECPGYSFSQWSHFLSLYPHEVAELHQYGLASFFLSRFDGSFYRQFGITFLREKKQFEIAIAMGFLSAIRKRRSNESMTDDKLVALQLRCESIMHNLEGYPEEGFCYGEGKAGGSEDSWKEIYKLWESLDLEDLPEYIPVLSNVIMAELEKFVPEGTVKEYDGFVTHYMIRSISDNTLPSYEEHLLVLNTVLRNDINSTDKYIQKLAGNLKTLLGRGDVHILHDIGLDPMVDDFIALKIIATLREIRLLDKKLKAG